MDDAVDDLGRIAIRKRPNRKIEAAGHAVTPMPTKIDRGADLGVVPPIRVRNHAMRNHDAVRLFRLG